MANSSAPPPAIPVSELFAAKRPGMATILLVGFVTLIWLLVGPLELLDAEENRWLLKETDAWTGSFQGILLAALVHFDWYHLLLNAVGLVFFGSLVERRFGSWRMIAVFSVTAVFANLFSLLASRAVSIPSLGSSGGLMGLMGCHVAEQFLSREDPRTLLDDRPSRSILTVLLLLLVLESLLLLQPIVRTYIDHAAHLGGFVAGVGITVFLMPLRDDRPRSRQLFLRLVLGLGLIQVGAYGAYPIAKPLFHQVHAQIALANADYRNAERFASRAIALEERMVQSHIVLAQAFEALESYDKAETHFRRAVEMAPIPTGDITLPLALFLHLHGTPEEADELFASTEESLVGEITKRRRTLTGNDGGGVRIWADLQNMLAWMFAMFGRKLEEGKERVEAALARQPRDPAYLGTLGVLELELGELDVAIRHLTQAVSLHETPLFRAHDLYYLAIALHRRGSFEESLESLAQAIRLDPASPVRKIAEKAFSQGES